MTVEARWRGILIAASDSTILVEGNHYFPPQAVVQAALERSDSTSHCPWKGDASYYHVVLEGDRNDDAAWYYPAPYEAAAPIAHYVAFWRGVAITGSNAGEPEIVPPPRGSRPSSP